MEDDWDLYAVVRGRAATSTSAVSSDSAAASTDLQSRSCLSSSFSTDRDESYLLCFPNPFETRDSFQDLQDLYKPFFPKTQNLSSTLPVVRDQSTLQLKQSVDGSKAPVSSLISTTAAHSSSPRTKRRKNQQKRVCHVPAEGLSSDMWSWRKYGSKPIKGSPYPRGYYRCSSSKGCLARKQVERNRSDAGMLIVTYTNEHNHPIPTHRNSLAGSTRQKPATAQTVKPSSSSSPQSTFSPADVLSPTTSFLEEGIVEQSKNEESRGACDEEEDEVGKPTDMELSDDFFEGLEEFAGTNSPDIFPDHFPATFTLPFIASNATTTAGGV